jgi:hypothetical protein
MSAEKHPKSNILTTLSKLALADSRCRGASPQHLLLTFSHSKRKAYLKIVSNSLAPVRQDDLIKIITERRPVETLSSSLLEGSGRSCELEITFAWFALVL